MNELTVNSETGFLESRSPYHSSFDSTKKLKVIELVNQFAREGKWPRLSVIAKLCDCGMQTIRDHLAQDSEFKAAFEEAMSLVEENLVENLNEQGKKANGITANIFLLKSRWRERWGDQPSGISVDFGSLKDFISRIGKPKQYIEGEVLK